MAVHALQPADGLFVSSAQNDGGIGTILPEGDVVSAHLSDGILVTQMKAIFQGFDLDFVHQLREEGIQQGTGGTGIDTVDVPLGFFRLLQRTLQASGILVQYIAQFPHCVPNALLRFGTGGAGITAVYNTGNGGRGYTGGFGDVFDTGHTCKFLFSFNLPQLFSICKNNYANVCMI